MSTTTATIILAAGAGRRLGGQSKALLALPPQGLSPEHSPAQMLGPRALGVALRAGTSPVLVLGYEAGQVERTLRAAEPELLARTRVVRAEGWEEGLSASFRSGVRAASDAGFERCAVLLADQPGIDEHALAAVLGEHEPGRITRGAVAWRPSHPVVFDIADALAAAQRAAGEEGARTYLREQAGRVDLVDITDLADDADLDTPEDLRRLQG